MSILDPGWQPVFDTFCAICGSPMEELTSDGTSSDPLPPPRCVNKECPAHAG